MMWVPGCASAAGAPTELGETATASSDISLSASVPVQLEVGQVGVADIPVRWIRALEHETRGILGSGDALGSEGGRLYTPPSLLDGVETCRSGTGRHDAGTVIDETISGRTSGSGDRAVEILQDDAGELARSRLEDVGVAEVAPRDRRIAGAPPDDRTEAPRGVARELSLRTEVPSGPGRGCSSSIRRRAASGSLKYRRLIST